MKWQDGGLTYIVRVAGSNRTRGRMDATEGGKEAAQQGKWGRKREREFLTGYIDFHVIYGSTNCQGAITSANNAGTIALINLL